MRFLALPLIGLMAACNPPAADETAERGDGIQTGAQAPPGLTPLPSPDTQGAIWGTGGGEMRLLYGFPGRPPIMALACETDAGDTASVRLTRYAPTQDDAQALMALVGNGTVTRVKMDSAWTGKGWRWEGTIDAASNDLDVLTGRRSIEATLPGAGSVILNPSDAPRNLIRDCRRGIIQPPPQSDQPEEVEDLLVEEERPD